MVLTRRRNGKSGGNKSKKRVISRKRRNVKGSGKTRRSKNKTRSSKVTQQKGYIAKPLKKSVGPHVRMGILSVPTAPYKKYKKSCGDSYISGVQLRWMEREGIEMVIIPYDTNNLISYLDSVQGIYLSPGGTWPGIDEEYYHVVKKVIEYGRRENDRGRYYPILGICLGFQQMMIESEGSDKIQTLLRTVDMYGHFTSGIALTDYGHHSRILSSYSPNERKMMEFKEIARHNNHLGIIPEVFYKHKSMSDKYEIVALATDRNGRPMIDIIEAKNYPFYGFQFHPEASPFWRRISTFMRKELQKGTIKKKSMPKVSTHTTKCIFSRSGKYLNLAKIPCVFVLSNNSKSRKRECESAYDKKMISDYMYDGV